MLRMQSIRRRAERRAATIQEGRRMSKEDLDALLVKYRDDAAFAEKIDAAEDAEAVIAVAADHGLELDAADIATAAGELKLSDAELESVAGGYSCSPNCAPPKGALGNIVGGSDLL
jgi:predicted ribosomally synthesized peptide with nif11-like leader